LSKGFTRFKAKVGKGVEEDLHRLKVIREEIGPDRILVSIITIVRELSQPLVKRATIA